MEVTSFGTGRADMSAIEVPTACSPATDARLVTSLRAMRFMDVPVTIWEKSETGTA